MVTGKGPQGGAVRQQQTTENKVGSGGKAGGRSEAKRRRSGLLSLLRRRRPGPLPPIAAPKTAAETAAAELVHLGAESWSLPLGFWVYALHQADGSVFYAGQSANLLRRMYEHVAVYGSRIARVSRIRCYSQYDMDVLEVYLIHQLQPVENLHGTALDDYRRKARTMANPYPINRRRTS